MPFPVRGYLWVLARVEAIPKQVGADSEDRANIGRSVVILFRNP